MTTSHDSTVSSLIKYIDSGKDLTLPSGEIICRDPSLENGYIKFREQLNGMKYISTEVCRLAAVYGLLDILKYLHAYGYSGDINCTIWAAERNHFEVLKWLVSEGCPVNESTFSSAASAGNSEIIMWLIAQKCPWDAHTCDRLASNGHFDLMFYVHGLGCPWDEWVCAHAAYHGRLDVLKKAKAEGCPWNEYVCKNAACSDHLELLKWARAEGCPWDQWTCSSAAYNGNLEILIWAKENGCPWDVINCLKIANLSTKKPNEKLVPWIIIQVENVTLEQWMASANEQDMHTQEKTEMIISDTMKKSSTKYHMDRYAELVQIISKHLSSNAK